MASRARAEGRAQMMQSFFTTVCGKSAVSKWRDRPAAPPARGATARDRLSELDVDVTDRPWPSLWEQRRSVSNRESSRVMRSEKLCARGMLLRGAQYGASLRATPL
jgi:hypothetical protein